MIPTTLAALAVAVDGRLDAADPTAVVTDVVIDSRTATPGSLFVALTGEHTDGHDHVADATGRGAAASLTAHPVGTPAVVVADPRAALADLARDVLTRAAQCRVTGITGSSGKTSTKDLIAAVLADVAPTVAAAGSYNNEIGLPLTVCSVSGSTRHLVLEYGARGGGHIRTLTEIARPDVSVVLNVASAHLGEFGSREAIAVAKGELVEALLPGGHAILNADDSLVAAMVGRTDATVTTFGTASDAAVRIEALDLDDAARPRFRLVTPVGTAAVALRLHGAHHASNVAAAVAVALVHGLDLDRTVGALGEFRPVSAHRMAVHDRSDGLVVVDDAYNANPESTRAAVDALARLSAGRRGRSWLVLGEMRELGPTAAALHYGTGEYAARAGIDVVVAVGEPAAAVVDGARGVAGWRGQAQAVASADDAVALLADAGSEDTVLVKASNAARLWEVAERLLAAPVATGQVTGRGAGLPA